jgi:hypothetical protein
MTRTLTLFCSVGFRCGERKCSEGNSSENADELHDEGNLMDESRVLLEKDGNEKRIRMAIESFQFASL